MVRIIKREGHRVVDVLDLVGIKKSVRRERRQNPLNKETVITCIASWLYAEDFCNDFKVPGELANRWFQPLTHVSGSGASRRAI